MDVGGIVARQGALPQVILVSHPSSIRSDHGGINAGVGTPKEKEGGTPLPPEFDQAAAASSVSLGVSAIVRLKESK